MTDEPANRQQRRALASATRRGEAGIDRTPPKVTVLQSLGNRFMNGFGRLFPRRQIYEHFAFALLAGALIGFIGGAIVAGLIFAGVMYSRHKVR